MHFDYNGHLHDICVDRRADTAAVLGLHLSRPLAVYQLSMNPGKRKKSANVSFSEAFIDSRNRENLFISRTSRKKKSWGRTNVMCAG